MFDKVDRISSILCEEKQFPLIVFLSFGSDEIKEAYSVLCVCVSLVFLGL